MGSIGGSEWTAPGIPFTSVMNQLQSPTVAVSDGTLVANTLFNTGLATQLSPQFAMAIHAIRWNFFTFNLGATQSLEDAFLGTISEDVGATTAASELTDPRTLAEAGQEYTSITITAVGEQYQHSQMLWTAKYSPPIWTIAQRLNILGQISEGGAGTSPAVDIHAKLYYTIEEIDDQMMRNLVQRLNLATQP